MQRFPQLFFSDSIKFSLNELTDNIKGVVMQMRLSVGQFLHTKKKNNEHLNLIVTEVSLGTSWNFPIVFLFGMYSLIARSSAKNELS